MSVLALIFLVIILLALSAVCSGLAFGLLSLNLYELKRKSQAKDAAASLIYPIRARGNELLVSLVIINAIVDSAIVLVVAAIIPGNNFASTIFTIVFSSVLIAIFAGIIPQAYFKQHGLAIGARFAPYIIAVMEVMRPVSKPLSKMLDRSGKGYSPDMQTAADELMLILKDHEATAEKQIETDELEIVRHALSFGDKFVRDVMTPNSMVLAIEAGQEFTMGALKELTESGHSRFPVYEGDINNIVGILYIRDLIAKKNQNLTAGQAADRQVNFVNEKQMLDHALNAFLKTKRHLFIVVNEFGETVGIITIEDILEEIIGHEIVDEFDKFDDLRAVAKLRAKKRPRAVIGGKIK
jgi:CBS domain containing-hemolysin-like protein